jgi:hypothetical protein
MTIGRIEAREEVTRKKWQLNSMFSVSPPSDCVAERQQVFDGLAREVGGNTLLAP